MKLVNRRTGAVLADRVELAASLAARLRGLIGRTELNAGEALLIDPCTSIHTFFMRFPVDVVFLSREHLVIRAISALRPWRLTRVYPRAAMVVELKAGTVSHTATREGDALQLAAV